MIHAVSHGDDHKPNSSYVKRMSAKSATAIHLLRSLRGQVKRGWMNRRMKLRASMKGHAMQKKLPATRITRTRAPRKCTQVSTVARFFGEIDGPKSPCRIITRLTSSSGI